MRNMSLLKAHYADDFTAGMVSLAGDRLNFGWIHADWLNNQLMLPGKTRDRDLGVNK
jgi:hypothetical protein